MFIAIIPVLVLVLFIFMGMIMDREVSIEFGKDEFGRYISVHYISYLFFEDEQGNEKYDVKHNNKKFYYL